MLHLLGKFHREPKAHVFANQLPLCNLCCAQALEGRHHLLDEVLRGGGAGGDANAPHSLKPRGVNFSGVIDEVGPEAPSLPDDLHHDPLLKISNYIDIDIE